MTRRTSLNKLPHALLLLTTGLLSSLSVAHPHMWIDARVDLILNDQGELARVRQAWTFDDMFSSYAIHGLSLDSKRQPKQEDLDAIAADWIEALGDPMSHYFTDIEQNGDTLPTRSASAVSSSWDVIQSRLTLSFELPLQTPAQPRTGAISIRVADPTFFVAYEFDADQINQALNSSSASQSSQLPRNCETRYVPPRELDTATANRLASIPASQAEPPPELLAITRTLQHRIEFSCAP